MLTLNCLRNRDNIETIRRTFSHIDSCLKLKLFARHVQLAGKNQGHRCLANRSITIVIYNSRVVKTRYLCVVVVNPIKHVMLVNYESRVVK